MIKHFLLYIAVLVLLLNSLFLIAENGEYETPLVVQAKEVVPKDFLESDLYAIDNEVITRGYTNTYKIKSKYGDFEVHGNQMLAQRIQEIKAIHALEEIRKSEKFKDGVKNAAKSHPRQLPIKSGRAPSSAPGKL